MDDLILTGSIIKCTAGRDKDRHFVVTAVLEGPFVQISDGKTRKVQKPKVKKLRHIAFVNSPDSDILRRIEEKNLTNSILRRYLSEYNNINAHIPNDNTEGGNTPAKG